MALVTGGNRGLGLETCRQLGRAGVAVIVAARDAAAGEAAAEAIGAAFRPLDVTDPGSIAALAGALAAEGRAVDILVNNAAIALDGFDGTVARQTIDANFYGPMHVTDAVLPLIPEGGNVVMVSSGVGELSGLSPRIRGRFAGPDLTREALSALMEAFVEDVAQGRWRAAGWPGSAYRVSKAGLNALTRILAGELASRRIKVNAVCPGWVRTRMGGASAPRSLADGAASIVWAALLPEDGPSGGLFRDGRRIAW